ncbi:MAG: hypothetical protein ACI4L2_00945 [Wujia sp.]
MKNRKIKNRIIVCICALLCVLIVTGSVLAPKYFLEKTVSADVGQVMDAPEEYYVDAGAAMAREISENLSAPDRIKLISGAWESEMTECEKTEGFLDETEAVSLAKQQMELYHSQGVYPYSIDSEFDNWYSYSTELYRFTDSSFHTYTAYLWKLTFTKYDQSIVQQIYMTESGTILLARVNSTHHMAKPVLTCYENLPLKELFGENDIYMSDVVEHSVPSLKIPYPDVEQENLKIDSGALITVRVSGELENYEAFQFNTDSGFGIVLMPIQF